MLNKIIRYQKKLKCFKYNAKAAVIAAVLLLVNITLSIKGMIHAYGAIQTVLEIFYPGILLLVIYVMYIIDAYKKKYICLIIPLIIFYPLGTVGFKNLYYITYVYGIKSWAYLLAYFASLASVAFFIGSIIVFLIFIRESIIKRDKRRMKK